MRENQPQEDIKGADIAMGVTKAVVETAVDFGKAVITGNIEHLTNKPAQPPIVVAEAQQLAAVRAELQKMGTPVADSVPQPTVIPIDPGQA